MHHAPRTTTGMMNASAIAVPRDTGWRMDQKVEGLFIGSSPERSEGPAAHPCGREGILRRCAAQDLLCRENHLDLSAPIQLPPRLRRVVRDRIGRAASDGLEAVRVDVREARCDVVLPRKRA